MHEFIIGVISTEDGKFVPVIRVIENGEDKFAIESNKIFDSYEEANLYNIEMIEEAKVEHNFDVNFYQ